MHSKQNLPILYIDVNCRLNFLSWSDVKVKCKFFVATDFYVSLSDRHSRSTTCRQTYWSGLGAKVQLYRHATARPKSRLLPAPVSFSTEAVQLKHFSEACPARIRSLARSPQRVYCASRYQAGRSIRRQLNQTPTTGYSQSNFAMGYPQSDRKDTLYLLDFGLSRFIMDEKSQLRPPRSKVGFRGTVRYCSAVAHKRQVEDEGDTQLRA